VRPLDKLRYQREIREIESEFKQELDRNRELIEDLVIVNRESKES